MVMISVSSFLKFLMPNTVKAVHHIFRINCYGGNNNLTTLGLLLLLDIIELLHLKTSEITNISEIRPDFQMEVSVDARDAEETICL